MQQCDIGFRETKQWAAAISISHTFPGDQMVANDADSNVHNLLTCRKAIPGTAAAACCVGPVVCAAGWKNQWYFFSLFSFFCSVQPPSGPSSAFIFNDPCSANFFQYETDTQQYSYFVQNDTRTARIHCRILPLMWRSVPGSWQINLYVTLAWSTPMVTTLCAESPVYFPL